MEHTMTIKVGDKVPAIGFSIMTGEGPKPLSSEELFAGKKLLSGKELF